MEKWLACYILRLIFHFRLYFMIRVNNYPLAVSVTRIMTLWLQDYANNVSSALGTIFHFAMKCTAARDWDRERWSYKEKVKLGMYIPSLVLGSLDYIQLRLMRNIWKLTEGLKRLPWQPDEPGERAMLMLAFWGDSFWWYYKIQGMFSCLPTVTRQALSACTLHIREQELFCAPSHPS